MSGSFADSNILIYALSNDQQKADVAEGILLGDFTISVQVLNEAALVLVRKHRMGWPELGEFLARIKLSATTVLPVTVEVHERGLDIVERHKLRIYDSMIIAAALIAGCETLYSEDMHHGLVVEDQFRIVNPFRELKPPAG